MGLKDLTQAAVTAALDEFDALGRDAFLKRYGFGPARSYFVERDGVRYDSKAIAGAAHGHLEGREPLRSANFTGGEKTVSAALTALGFDVVKLTKDAPRNPPWSRDELILALDFYMRHREHMPSQTSKPIAEVSATLNDLAMRTGGGDAETFRNPNGVYMKMMNFRRLDPEVAASGGVGLVRGNKDEQVVWDLFADDPERLAAVAKAIRQQVTLPVEIEDLQTAFDEDLVEAPEGKILTRLHRYKERNRKLVENRKAKALKETGKLECEVCGFDFEKTYGARGKGFIEAHHTKPVHTLPEEGKTKLEDLALVCSNCHRMIHSSRPWLSVEELKKSITLKHQSV